MKKNIGIDIDGVLVDFETSWVKTGLQATGLDLNIVDEKSFFFGKRYGIAEDVVYKIIDAMDWGEISPYSDEVNAVNDLFESGHEIHLITSSPLDVSTIRENSLKDYGFMFHSIECVGIHCSKESAIREIGLDVFFDDRMVNLEAAYNAGVSDLYFIDRGYGLDGFKGKELPNVKTHFNFSDAKIDYVDMLSTSRNSLDI